MKLEPLKRGAVALLALLFAVPLAQAQSTGAARGMPGSAARGGTYAPPAASVPRVGGAPSVRAPVNMGGTDRVRGHLGAPGRGHGGNWSGGGPKPSGGVYVPRGKPGKPWVGGGYVKPGHGGGHHGHHRPHRRGIRVYSAPLYYDYEDYSYRGDDCGWLWQRWLQTGNPKWKRRYYNCID